ncbi:unnamed protein product [Linum tenue]|uniref:Aminotransferase-like plant mobile domain-containing protein n=1 Tax=Linum tenue TaxID=586396 RepID=A0AAV0P735_9ROSI|nr:unnamed protein product [Linum tenue]
MASEYLQANETHVTEAQSYLLLLLGSTLFVDKSRDRVRLVVNLFLDDLEEVDQYSWPSGTLAWLYRYLGKASRVGARGWLVVSHLSIIDEPTGHCTECRMCGLSTGSLRDSPFQGIFLMCPVIFNLVLAYPMPLPIQVQS